MITEIKSLADTSLEDIVACNLVAFQNYFEKMPEEVGFYKNSFFRARVDLSCSYGVFSDGNLVAFVIIGLDQFKGELHAFNLATGVIPSFRGQGLVDRIFAALLPELKNKGVRGCKLEVIKENKIAIRVYERIGFSIGNTICYYEGDISAAPHSTQYQSVDFEDAIVQFKSSETAFTWAHQDEGIRRAGKAMHTNMVLDSGGDAIGYFVLEHEKNRVARVVANEGTFVQILQAIHHTCKKPSFCCLESVDQELISALEKAGLQHTDTDFEMDLRL